MCSTRSDRGVEWRRHVSDRRTRTARLRGYRSTRLHLEFSFPTVSYPRDLVERLRETRVAAVHVDLGFGTSAPLATLARQTFSRELTFD